MAQVFYGDTYRTVSTDSPQTLAANVIEHPNMGAIEGALIWVEDNDIRYAHNVDPVHSGDANKLGIVQAASGPLMLEGFDDCRSFRFISSTVGMAAVLQITPFYNRENIS